eukprot:TRINITY_DN943_c0_g1_i2.p2 TRINITY_DN943_c0_g1~~TRINITY_DN943_c0_g1_i2.p2  ORF type:complete len:149 (+),score=23.65 TRINITY_DN943_c0_g1_i2:176-622(+)
MGSYISSLLCTVLAITYPVYASFKAIESDNKEDDTMWLMYWVVYSLFAFLESIADSLIFWIPFYYEVKLIVLLLLQFPQLKLSVTLYNTHIRPFLKQNETKIDSLVSDAKVAVGQKVHEVAVTAGPRIVSAVLSASQGNSPQTQRKSE